MKRLIPILLMIGWQCTYDSTPPDADKINDGKPLLMLDLAGFSALRSVQIQYTDALGTTTLATAAEKTDATGRLVYPLYMARGTRNLTMLLRIDENGDGAFTSGAGDRKCQFSAAFVSDSEIKKVVLNNAADFSVN